MCARALTHSINWEQYRKISGTNDEDVVLFAKFMAELTPWAVAPRDVQLRYVHGGLAERTTCADPDFAHLFTGQRRHEPRKVLLLYGLAMSMRPRIRVYGYIWTDVREECICYI